MEQHPIPTNVSSYQFKLVGDMTLKQFFQLAGGILIGIMFYSSPLLPIIKWPLAILSGLLGIGLAFLPFEERPLERWIIAFFRAIYSPTIFTWQRGSDMAAIFMPETDPAASAAAPQNDAALKDYLSKSNQTPTAAGNLEKAESGFLSKLTALINNLSTPLPKQSLASNNVTENPVTPTQPHPTQSPLTQPAPTITQDAQPLVNPVPQPAQINIPITPNIRVPAMTSHMVVEEMQSNNQNQFSSTAVSQVVAGNEMISTHQAMFSVDAAPPHPPTTANVVVGQVVDQDRRIAEGAIMEIRDSNGRPIRALRSNKVGHFITVTPLDNGHYEIITEKDGYEFTPVSFDANGAIIPPILVQGKRLSQLLDMPDKPVKPAYSIN